MRTLRKILWPFAVPYDGVTRVRNYLFDKQIFESRSYDFPVIGIGNLSVGGTGKTPMTEYVLNLLRNKYTLATLSRGYGRTTSGYRDVTSDSKAVEVGDEPLQFAMKFPEVHVAVCERRLAGIEQLRLKKPKPEVIILDDVFQHRKVKPGFLIMLTAFNDLFYEDLVLPAGNLRESRAGAERAHAIIVTKCPADLSLETQKSIAEKIGAYAEAKVFFSTIAYGELHDDTQMIDWSQVTNQKISVVTGIAKPQPFLTYLTTKGVHYEHIAYGDHHNFSEKELAALDQKECIITTEKDYMRLKGKLKKAQLYYLPIAFQFLKDAEVFNESILEFVES
ncbi:tetraacyldisaccharide 4'-kinase [Leeuwenhoekiella blandensis]|uniref:tetraacyldisaccharide 4'-kinase n=1 Tax=Leeuwenhoekiella blandensis TaxID=360293 RepID=UPI002357360F|nr:tetraacyldisaccharide 4'-kinase [Leeuwenhoekiella blandensis]